MALRDLFTTARLVTLLVMASATQGFVKTPRLRPLSAHDSRRASPILSDIFSFMKRLGDRLDTLEATLRFLQDSFYDEFAGTKREMGEMMTRVITLTDTIEEQFSFLRSDVENSWKQLQNNTEESASKTLNAFQSVATKMNNTIFNKVQSAVKDLFPTKT
ncbi:hypothetical protein EGW08_018962, partial [Elysia chlorotica]